MKNDAVTQKLDELTDMVAKLTQLIEGRAEGDLIPVVHRATDGHVDLSQYDGLDPEEAQQRLAAEFERIVLARRMELINR